MAEVLVSPGVRTQELDNSYSRAGAGSIGASLVGLTKKGPAYLPVEVNSMGEFREIFGNMDTRMYVPYAAQSYFKNASTLNVVRVLGRGTATVGGAVILSFPNSTTGVSGATAALSSSNTVLGVLRFRGTVEEAMVSGSPASFAIAIPGKGVTATNLSMTESSSNYIGKVLGTDPTQVKSGDALTAVYVDAIFNYAVGGSNTGSVSGNSIDGMFSSATANSTQITGGFSPAKTTTVVSQNFGGQVYDLFQVFTRSDGDAANTDIKISITQVDLVATGSPSFSLLVRAASDRDDQAIVYESFNDINLDPSSKQYIGRVIGDRKPVYDLTQDPPEILYDGEYANKSSYIRVSVEDGFPSNSRPGGFKGYDKISTVPYIPELPTVDNHLDSNNTVNNSTFLGIDFSKGGVYDRIKSSIASASGTLSADTGILYMAATSDYAGSGTITSYQLIDLVGSNSGNFSSTNKLRFTFPVYKGFDGLDPRSDFRVDINDGTLSGDFQIAIRTLANPQEIDTNLIIAPGAHSSSVGNIPQMILDTVTRRGDAFTIVDLSDGTATANAINLSVANAISEATKYDTNYGATYYPWIRVNDVDNDKLVWVPPSVEVLGAYAYNDRISQPWFAPAGFTRGGLENVIEARRRLTQGQRDDLYNKGVNPIATFPGQGISIWGQKTLQKKATLLDRVNVRRMLLEVRKTIAGFSRTFVFEQNTPSLRSKLQARINSYLSSVQSAQGLNEFRAILDETTTTPDLIDRNIVKGKIFLKPTTAVEFIILDFNVSNTGATFSE